MVDYKGRPFQGQPPTYNPFIEPLPTGDSWCTRMGEIAFRDPDHFVSGQLHEHSLQWDDLLELNSNDQSRTVKRWIHDKINIYDFMQPFKGNFAGLHLDSEQPPAHIFLNYKVCEPYKCEIAQILEDRIANGSLELLGRVGLVQPPHIIMPLVIVENHGKIRLCHDERYLNLFMSLNPFSLEGLPQIPHMLVKGDLIASTDEKSAYDGLLLSEAFRKFFGLEFAGWYLQYITLPFGWSVSPYIYQSVGMQVTTYLRRRGVITLQYLDDRFLGPLKCKTLVEAREATGLSIFLNSTLLSYLGYTIALQKSTWVPTVSLRFLGLLVHSDIRAFQIPEDKKTNFKLIREKILTCNKVHIKQLQQFMGKCMALSLCVPAARLYIRVMAVSISRAQKSTKLIQISGELYDEITMWRFIDTHSDSAHWRPQRHVELTFATDASGFAWGAMIAGQSIHDFWDTNDKRPIHLKETDALIHAIQSVPQLVQNKRVDALVDNMALVLSWEKLGCKDMSLNKLLKKLFSVVANLNCDLRLQHIPSAENPADAPSRKLALADARLSSTAWRKLQLLFGPHTFDLMALDSNVMRDNTGARLPHYSPHPLPLSSGVNVLSQSLSTAENYYCFPPFCMLEPVVTFILNECSPSLRVTLVIPTCAVERFWWPLLTHRHHQQLDIGQIGQSDIIEAPTQSGYAPYSLRQPLQVIRLCPL